jgi:hypothetical protein
MAPDAPVDTFDDRAFLRGLAQRMEAQASGYTQFSVEELLDLSERLRKVALKVP